MGFKPQDENAEGKPSKLPITLSAFVFPGAGQFAQKRWMAGVLFSTVFTICLTALMISIFVPLYHNLMAALDLAEKGNADEFMLMSLPGIILLFFFGIVTYLASLADTTRAYRQAVREWQQGRRGGPPDADVV